MDIKPSLASLLGQLSAPTLEPQRNPQPPLSTSAPASTSSSSSSSSSTRPYPDAQTAQQQWQQQLQPLHDPYIHESEQYDLQPYHHRIQPEQQSHAPLWPEITDGRNRDRESSAEQADEEMDEDLRLAIEMSLRETGTSGPAPSLARPHSLPRAALTSPPLPPTEDMSFEYENGNRSFPSTEADNESFLDFVRAHSMATSGALNHSSRSISAPAKESVLGSGPGQRRGNGRNNMERYRSSTAESLSAILGASREQLERERKERIIRKRGYEAMGVDTHPVFDMQGYPNEIITENVPVTIPKPRGRRKKKDQGNAKAEISTRATPSAQSIPEPPIMPMAGQSATPAPLQFHYYAPDAPYPAAQSPPTKRATVKRPIPQESREYQHETPSLPPPPPTKTAARHLDSQEEQIFKQETLSPPPLLIATERRDSTATITSSRSVTVKSEEVDVPVNPETLSNSQDHLRRGLEYPMRYPQATFLNTHVEGMEPSPHTIQFGDLVDKDNLFLAILSTESYNKDWLRSFVPNHIPQCIIRNWKGNYGDQAGYKTTGMVTEVLPPLEKFGNYHPRMMLLFYRSFCRVVIGSANLRPEDWEELTNTLYIQDFPLLPEKVEDAKDMPEFGYHLIEFLALMHVPRKIIRALYGINFSSAKLILIDPRVDSNVNILLGIHPVDGWDVEEGEGEEALPAELKRPKVSKLPLQLLYSLREWTMKKRLVCYGASTRSALPKPVTSQTLKNPAVRLLHQHRPR
ncbi:hypothetical protein BGW38_005909 [Lunasporangiospora selenospora]|uniref:Uncharacterized protein n=1 Tax=Lunasporangiospora selenospora TaxID=979761 RepID=A0A9P6G038_9FUNG|nr:hypothetical protein BGW38_005909 [Lunasporangiospora selenospora]